MDLLKSYVSFMYQRYVLVTEHCLQTGNLTIKVNIQLIKIL